MVQMTA